MPIESMMPSNYLILFCPLLLLPSIFPSIRVFSSESDLCIRGQSIGASASALPMNIQSWFPLGLTGLISLQSKGLSRVFSNITVQKLNSLALSLLYGPTLISVHDYWKNHSFDEMDLRWQSDVSVISYMVQVCHSFSSKEKASFNLWLQSPSGVILEPKKIKSAAVSSFFPSICHEEHFHFLTCQIHEINLINCEK